MNARSSAPCCSEGRSAAETGRLPAAVAATVAAAASCSVSALLLPSDVAAAVVLPSAVVVAVGTTAEDRLLRRLKIEDIFSVLIVLSLASSLRVANPTDTSDHSADLMVLMRTKRMLW